jgi:hypothetical protein
MRIIPRVYGTPAGASVRIVTDIPAGRGRDTSVRDTPTCMTSRQTARILISFAALVGAAGSLAVVLLPGKVTIEKAIAIGGFCSIAAAKIAAVAHAIDPNVDKAVDSESKP